jgi:hypothetical protein
MLCNVLHQYTQFPTLGRNLALIVPLLVGRSVIPQAYWFPIQVAVWVNVRLSTSNSSEKMSSYPSPLNPVQVLTKSGVATAMSSGISNLDMNLLRMGAGRYA